MANANRLDGLMKWAGRPEWTEEMQEVIDQHIASVCDGYDIGPEELADLIGEAGVMNLWGCAFEDLVAREFDEGNLADDYLKRRGWKESADKRSYIKALRNACMSLYEVSGVKRDQGFFVRDLLRGGEPVWVNEKLGTHGLAEWDRIGVRVIEVNGRVQTGGAVLRFSREASEEVIASFEEMKNSTRKEMTGMLTSLIEAAEAEGKLPQEVDGADVEEFKQILGALAKESNDEPLGIEGALETGASEFTNIWLEDTLDRLTGPRLPQLFNSDGEPIEWIEIAYPLAKGTKQADVAAALCTVPSLRSENAKFWNWLETEKKSIPAAIPKQGQMLTTQMDDGATVLGTLELEGRKLILAVNSEERAERGQALVEGTLAGLVGIPELERRSMEELMADTSGSPAADGIDLPENVRAEIEAQFLKDHYAAMLDEPIPALDNVSPREAVKTRKGREKTVEWLKEIENHHTHLAFKGRATHFDHSWMWEELGLSDRRS
jgi:hypothetical protein